MGEAGRLANLPDVLVAYRLHSGSTNWKNDRTQMRNKPRLLAEAYRRRGREAPNDLKFGTSWQAPKVQQYRYWLWSALKNKNVSGARRHAWSLLKSTPLSISAWRAAYCAVRGY
jgi:hypothetical protein